MDRNKEKLRIAQEESKFTVVLDGVYSMSDAEDLVRQLSLKRFVAHLEEYA
jgi:hypothetical protein